MIPILTRYRLFIGLISLLFAIHLSYIPNGFTWLDHGDIEEKRAVVPLSQLSTAFVSRYGQTGYYRPLVTIMHSIDYALYGNWAPGYHLTNIVLHLLVSITAAFFVRQFVALTKKQMYLIIAIVGVHAANWFTVGTISNIQELLVVLFSMLTVIFHVQTRTKPTRRNVLLTYFCFGLGLLAKETAVFWIPTSIVFWEITQTHVSGKNKVQLWIGELVQVIFYVGLHIAYVPEIWKTQTVTMTIPEALGTRLSSLGMLLVKLWSPITPSVSDATAIVGLSHPIAIATICGIVASGIFIYKYGIKNTWSKILILGTITVLPSLNLLPLPRFSAPHYAYFPSIIVALAMVTISKIGKKCITVLIGVWLVISTWMTFHAGIRFQDDVHLFEPEAARDSQFKEGHLYLGNYYASLGQMEQARQEYQTTLTQHPRVIAYADRTAAAINLAGVFIAENNLEQAETILNTVINETPGQVNPTVTYNLALLSMKQKNYQNVVDLLEGKTGNKPEAYFLLAEALFRLDKKSEAIQILTQATPLLNSVQQKQLNIFIRNIEEGKITD